MRVQAPAEGRGPPRVGLQPEDDVDTFFAVLAIMLVAAIGLGIQYLWPRPFTVREHQRGLRYRRGKLISEVGAGRYWLRPRVDDIEVHDTRRRQALVAGQEVLTQDRVPIKVSLIAEFTVADVSKAVTSVESFRDALYSRLQLALREAVATRELDAALSERGELGATILAAVSESVADFGLELHSVSVRDFMMAGGLRNAYSDVIQARQQGLAALERARGESAAVRNLANAAQLMEKHPGLMQLRLLQAVETSTGNRIVVALDSASGKSELQAAAAEDA